RGVNGYIATCHYYADFMAGYFGLPRDKMTVGYPGIKKPLTAADPRPRGDKTPTIGYFPRVAPEQGLHGLADAYVGLRRAPNAPACRLRISGWLGEHNRRYFEEIMKKIAGAGLAGDVEHVDCPTLADKVQFLESLDILSVPTTYR